MREINESFAKSLNQKALNRLANDAHFYNECYSKRNCPETPKAVQPYYDSHLRQMRPRPSILWLLRLVILLD